MIDLSISSKLWSPQDEQFLKDNYLSMSNEQLADALGRSVPSVKAHIQSMCLYRKHMLTEQEKDYIRRNYATMGSKAIADKLGIEISQVKAFRDRNRLKRYGRNY